MKWIKKYKWEAVVAAIVTAYSGLYTGKKLEDHKAVNLVRPEIILELNKIADHVHNIDLNAQFTESFKILVLNKIQGTGAEVPEEVKYLGDMIDQLANQSRDFNNKMILEDYLCKPSYKCECKSVEKTIEQTSLIILDIDEDDNVATGTVSRITTGNREIYRLFKGFASKSDKEKCESVFKVIVNLKKAAQSASEAIRRL